MIHRGPEWWPMNDGPWLLLNTPSWWSNSHGFFSTFGELDFNSKMTFTIPFRMISPAGSECVIVLPGQYGPPLYIQSSMMRGWASFLFSTVPQSSPLISLFLIFFLLFFAFQFPDLSILGGIARILLDCPAVLSCDLLKSGVCLFLHLPFSSNFPLNSLTLQKELTVPLTYLSFTRFLVSFLSHKFLSQWGTSLPWRHSLPPPTPLLVVVITAASILLPPEVSPVTLAS